MFRKRSNNDPKNCRPISMLPAMSKVIIIQKNSQEYLDKNGLLYKY